MLRTPVFWVMYAMFVMVAAGGLMATAQLAPIAKDFKIADVPVSLLGLTLPALTFALAIDRVLNGLTRPFFGWVSDQIGRENTMFIAFALEARRHPARCTSSATNPVAFVMLTGLVFFAWGEIYSLFPATCADTFGSKFAAANAGLLYTAKGTAALLVPLSQRAGDRHRRLACGVHRRQRDERRRRAARLVRAAADAPPPARRGAAALWCGPASGQLRRPSRERGGTRPPKSFQAPKERDVFRPRHPTGSPQGRGCPQLDHQAGDAEAPELTDGFHLVIDALKLNGIDTIFGVPGIPITDLARLAQAEGMRVISFRHEQNAGNAAAAAGFLTQKPGICLTVSAPGFLNGLTALANATTNCFPMILISGSSEREIVDLQQGDYEEMDQLAIAKPLCKAAFRVLHAQDIGIGIARAIRAARVRPAGRRLSRPAGQAVLADHGCRGRPKSLVKVIDPAPRQIPAPDAVQRALDVLKGAKRPLIMLGKGAAYAQADAEIRALIEKTGIPYLPMSMAKGLLPDTHPQSAAAARSYVLAEADVVMLVGARLNWLLSHGKGKTWGGGPQRRKQFIQIDIEPTEIDSNVRDRRAAGRRHRLLRRRRCWPASAASGRSRRPSGPARSPSARTRTSPRWPRS